MTFQSSIFQAGVIALAIAASTFGAQAQTFRLAHHHAVGGSTDMAAQKMAELVSEKSGGRITLQVFPGAQLGQEREAFDLVTQGGIDISITSVGLLDGVYPPISVTSLPYVFRDWDHATAAYSGAFGEALVDGVRDATEAEILGFFHLGFRDMMFTGAPATTLAAISGRKMRSPENFVWIKMFELLGAQPTPVTMGEVYTAMQTGVAEGLDMPASTALDNHLEEVTSSLVKTGHMFASMLFAMNEQKFAALSPEDQALLKEAALETDAWLYTEVTIPAENAAYELLEAAGLTVAEPENIEEWRAAMAPLYDEIRGHNDGSSELIDILMAP